jgi:cytochrome c peroxidase
MTGDDTGLAPSQLLGVAAYSARHSFCPACHQQLNTRPNLADLLEETV